MMSANAYATLVNAVLPEYSISHLTGFAPPKSNAPAVEFSSPTLDPWLELGLNIPSLLAESNAKFRSAVDQLPLLSVPDDAPVEEWRLAYVILATLAAAYVWGTPEPDPATVDRLPYVLARPLRDVAYALEVEPGVTYVAGGIWNHRYRADKAPEEDEDGQLDTIVSFTGAPDETHFNLTTLRVERAGGEALVQALLASQLVAQAIRHTTHPDTRGLAQVHRAMASALQQTAAAIGRCTAELAKMRAGCDPEFFFHRLRPFLTGFASLPGGVFYPSEPGSGGNGEWLKPSGATAGQSSLFQSLDALLTVSHPSDQDQGSFVTAMRRAMPGCHVKFLESLPNLPSLRSYVRSLDPASAVVGGYNATVRELEGFRNEHIKIVTLYVIGPARRAQPQPTPNQPGETDEGQLRGTGGSNLARLLKGMRDDTRRTVLPNSDPE